MAGKLTSQEQRAQEDAKTCLKRGLDHLKKHSDKWEANKKMMMGYFGTSSENGIAEAYGSFRSLASNVLVSVPQPYFEAKKEEQRQIGNFLTSAVWHDFQVGRVRERFIKALWQNFCYGLGIIAEQVEPEYEYEGEGRDRKPTMIKTVHFSWTNPSPRDVLFDPDGFSTDLSDHRFVMTGFYKSITEIKGELDVEGEPYYKNLEDIEKLSRANPSMIRDARQSVIRKGGLGGEQDDNPNFHQIKLWAQYDRVTRRRVVITDADRRLIRMEDWPLPISINGRLQFPLQIMAMNTETDQFYPVPEMEVIRGQIRNLIKLNDQLMGDATGKIRKYVGLSPYVDESKMGKFVDSKRPNTFLVTTNNDAMLANANMPKVDEARGVIHKVEDIQIDPMTPQVMNEVRGQMQGILGYGSASRGGVPAIRSAKEAQRVADAVRVALQGRQTAIEECTQWTAMYHALLMKQTASEFPGVTDRYVHIVDKLQGIDTWLQFDPKEIPDESDIFCDVYVGSSTPQTLDSKRQQFLEEARTLWPLFEKAGYSPEPLIRRYGEVFQVKFLDSLMKNQRQAAIELLAALVEMGYGGINEAALLKGQMNLIDAVLPPSLKQEVEQAVHKAHGKGGMAPGPGGQQGQNQMPEGSKVAAPDTAPNAGTM